MNGETLLTYRVRSNLRTMFERERPSFHQLHEIIIKQCLCGSYGKQRRAELSVCDHAEDGCRDAISSIGFESTQNIVATGQRLSWDR